MKHPENDYIQAGYRLERATTPTDTMAQGQRIRLMLEAEHQDDHAEARRLIEQGIKEARK